MEDTLPIKCLPDNEQNFLRICMRINMKRGSHDCNLWFYIPRRRVFPNHNEDESSTNSDSSDEDDNEIMWKSMEELRKFSPSDGLDELFCAVLQTAKSHCVDKQICSCNQDLNPPKKCITVGFLKKIWSDPGNTDCRAGYLALENNGFYSHSFTSLPAHSKEEIVRQIVIDQCFAELYEFFDCGSRESQDYRFNRTEFDRKGDKEFVSWILSQIYDKTENQKSELCTNELCYCPKERKPGHRCFIIRDLISLWCSDNNCKMGLIGRLLEADRRINNLSSLPANEPQALYRLRQPPLGNRPRTPDASNSGHSGTILTSWLSSFFRSSNSRHSGNSRVAEDVRVLILPPQLYQPLEAEENPPDESLSGLVILLQWLRANGAQVMVVADDDHVPPQPAEESAAVDQLQRWKNFAWRQADASNVCVRVHPLSRPATPGADERLEFHMTQVDLHQAPPHLTTDSSWYERMAWIEWQVCRSRTNANLTRVVLSDDHNPITHKPMSPQHTAVFRFPGVHDDHRQLMLHLVHKAAEQYPVSADTALRQPSDVQLMA